MMNITFVTTNRQTGKGVEASAWKKKETVFYPYCIEDEENADKKGNECNEKKICCEEVLGGELVFCVLNNPLCITLV